jgi:DNA-binding response OmpR family regulator
VAHGKGGKILVIDDEPMVRSAVGRVLTDEGYTVEFAGDGAAALAKLTSAPPDAILLDLMMPGMNGRQFLHALRIDRGSTVPVVVMTAVHGLGQRAISLGATDAIEKPFDVDELLNKIALAVFRARQDTGEITVLPTGKVAARPDLQDVIVVIDDDLATLGRLDARLSESGFTVIALPGMPDRAPQLLRALAPAAVVVAAEVTTARGEAVTEIMGVAPGLDALPLIVFTRDDATPAPALPSAVVLTTPSEDDLLRIVELMSARPIERSGAGSPW